MFRECNICLALKQLSLENVTLSEEHQEVPDLQLNKSILFWRSDTDVLQAYRTGVLWLCSYFTDKVTSHLNLTHIRQVTLECTKTEEIIGLQPWVVFKRQLKIEQNWWGVISQRCVWPLRIKRFQSPVLCLTLFMDSFFLPLHACFGSLSPPWVSKAHWRLITRCSSERYTSLGSKQSWRLFVKMGSMLVSWFQLKLSKSKP